MYKKLLLSSQGGIVDEIHRSEQDNCAVVAIGLGGTGCDCLRNLKAKIFNRVIPDDAAALIPEYKHVKFIAVDTDKGDFEKANDKHSSIDKINMDTEFFDLSYEGNINEVFARNAQTLSNRGEFKEWLRFDDIRVEAARAGACGVRQIGRYLLMEKSNEFLTKVRNSISDAKRGLNSPKVYVHIFSGLGGGTGAGTFLDVCYLVQKALETEGTNNAFVCGYFFLPDVNLAKQLNEQTERYIKINGFASLQELDYCMNFERNGEKWSQRYPNVGLIETKNPPVNICHLISGHNSRGDVLENAYDYAMNVVTDYFMDFLIKSTSGFNMESHIANYNAIKAMLNKDSGANYEYCILGASNATLPYKEVLTYLSSYLFSKMANMNRNKAIGTDSDAFVRGHGLTYEALFTAAVNGITLDFAVPDDKPKDAYDNDELVTTYFADQRAIAVGIAAKNLNQMKKDIEVYNTENINGAAGKGNNILASSTITKIFHALNAIVMDPEKGPYYASSLINGTSGTDLVSYVNGYIETINSQISQLEFNLPQRETARKKAQAEFKSRCNGRNYKNYVATTKDLAQQYARQQIMYDFRDYLTLLSRQLRELATNYYRVYCTVITELCDTFVANQKYLEEIAGDQYDYVYPIASINDEKLRDTIETYLKESFDIPTQMTQFHQYMLSSEGHAAWKDRRENEISKLISKYFTGIFSSYTNKSMTQYLSEKYGTESPELLVNSVRGDIMNTLDQKANVLFWTSSQYSVGNAAKIGYTTVPAECIEVKTAAEGLESAKPELKVRVSDVKDRITIMRCLVGAPLFGYQPLRQYETTSVADNEIIGKHLYEGRNFKDEFGNIQAGRDWRRLPSPIPFSKMDVTNSPELFEVAGKRRSLYEAAEAKNILIKNAAEEYFVRVLDDAFVAEIEEKANKAIQSKDNVLMYSTQQAIQAMMEAPKYSSVTYRIPNDAKNGDSAVPESEKRIVRIDHFVSMPKICDVVENEINRFKRIDEIIEVLTPKVDTDFEDYANALFTGAITINGIMLTYVNDFFEEVKLSAPNMPMGGMRLYQAFVNFKALDEKTRENLKAIVDRRNGMEEADAMDNIIKACTNVKPQLDQKMIAMALQIAASKFASQAVEIREFYMNLAKKFDEYLMTYGIAV